MSDQPISDPSTPPRFRVTRLFMLMAFVAFFLGAVIVIFGRERATPVLAMVGINLAIGGFFASIVWLFDRITRQRGRQRRR